MPNDEKDIESLIVRHLDGELDEDERLELNRRLIRDPAARRMMEDYQKVDALSAEALGPVLKECGTTRPAAVPATSHPLLRKRRFSRSWWVIPGAVAAAVLAMVIPRAAVELGDKPKTSMVGRLPEPNMPARYNRSEPTAPMRTVGHGIPQIKRNTGREVIGVIGEDGNVYWIEVDRIRTTKVSPRRSESL